jgi:hypothetical protein
MTEHDFEPMTKEILIDLLTDLKDNWSEEIPARILHSTDGHYKIRTGWFLSLASDLEVALSEGLLQDKIKPDAEAFLDWWVNEYGTGQKGTIINTKVDINKGNAVITKILESFDVKPKK